VDAPRDPTLGAAYDAHYAAENFFGYRDWLYRPFVRSLARRAGLEPGARVLDLGCGQGQFTALFHDLGCEAHGVDLSPAGIRSARSTYRGSRLSFAVGDALELACREEFDCAFARSCSLYNRDDFAADRRVTDRFLDYVRPGGVCIFDYHTSLDPRRRSSTWRHHTLSDLERHFAAYPGTETFFTLRVETLALGARALGPRASRTTAALSRAFGLGGELVAIVRKQRAARVA
jgi:SAM-dependent methyltransferase